MNSKGIGTEQVLELILFVAAAVVIIGAFILVFTRTQTPVEAEGLRAKVEFAVQGKQVLNGVSS